MTTYGTYQPGLVSVITPCYNSARYVRSATESVLSQDYCHYEIILGDDGSSDGTQSILEEYAHIPNVRTLLLPSNRGPFVLRNMLIRQARGEFVAFLDSDDLWMPDKLSLQISSLRQNPSSALCHGYSKRFRDDCKVMGRPRMEAADFVGQCFHKMLVDNGVAASSVMLRRTALDDVGLFDERFKYRGDWELWTRIARKYQFAFVPRYLCAYRLHSSNVSNLRSECKAFTLAILDKFATEYGLTEEEIRKYLVESRHNVYRQYGNMALVERNLKAARRDLLAALTLKPIAPGAWLSLMKAYLYEIVQVAN